MSFIFTRKRKPVLEAVSQILILASFAVAVAYGIGWYPTEELWPVITKGAAVGLLAFFVLICIQSLNHFLLFLALTASVMGDVLLAMPIENSFVKGLSAFLVAQIIFVILYFKNRLPLSEVSTTNKRLVVLLWIVTVVSVGLLYPQLGDMLIPVLVYSSALALMATTALLSRYSTKHVGFGAILFVISDSTLGTREFFDVPDYLGYVVWGTYYFAQLFMTLGVMLTDERATKYGGYNFN